MTERELWQDALVQIELGTSEASFQTWFRGTDIVRRETGTIFLAVPSKIVKEWLREKHHKLILKTLRDLDESVRSIEYVVQKNVRAVPNKPTALEAPAEINRTLGLNEYYIDKRDNLNPRYTFDTFVVGPFNQMAHAAAQAVISRPGLSYNPLFFYGNTGHGKTHLIQAIGNYFKKTHSNKKVFYVTSERFTMDFLNALKEGRANNFKDQYRQYDVLIMDDIQFIADKDKTQEELFHLFNAFHDNNKQIIFSSDKHPNFVPGFEDRLKSRFNGGFIIEIPSPDLESRIAIITSKAQQYGCTMDQETVGYIAGHIQGNIREIEGLLNTIVCKTQLKGKSLNQLELQSILKSTARPNKGFSVEDVVKKVAQYYQIDEKTIYEKTRKKEVVKPRQIIMYVLREEFNVSYPSIGEKLGGRDHTTVIHSCEKIREDVKRDPSLETEIDQIKILIHNS